MDESEDQLYAGGEMIGVQLEVMKFNCTVCESETEKNLNLCNICNNMSG